MPQYLYLVGDVFFADGAEDFFHGVGDILAWIDSFTRGWCNDVSRET